MLRFLGFRPNPLVSLVIGVGVAVAGLIAGKILLIVVGAVMAVIGLVRAFGGRSSGAAGGPR